MLIKPAAFLDTISGRFGNIVFNDSPGQLTARNFVFPANPQTANQQSIRLILTALTKEWGTTLTVAQRQSWVDWAALNRVRNRLGNLVQVNGISAWLQNASLVWLATGASPTVKTAPTANEPAPPIGIETPVINFATSQFDVQVTMPDPLPANAYRLLFRLTDGLPSFGITPRPNEYRLIAGTDADSFLSPLNGLGDYSFDLTQIRTAMVEGIRVGLAVNVVDSYGQQSQLLRWVGVPNTNV